MNNKFLNCRETHIMFDFGRSYSRRFYKKMQKIVQRYGKIKAIPRINRCMRKVGCCRDCIPVSYHTFALFILLSKKKKLHSTYY